MSIFLLPHKGKWKVSTFPIEDLLMETSASPFFLFLHVKELLLLQEKARLNPFKSPSQFMALPIIWKEN